MKKVLCLASFMILGACASKLEKRNTIDDMDTKLKDEKKVSGGDKLGTRDDKVVVQRKVMLAEELRDLENETYAMEYEVYGNRKYGTKGLYGVYRDCHTDLGSYSLGGTGKMKPLEPAQPVITEDPFFKFGRDEEGELVGVNEEFLSERIDRFKKYRKLLTKRRNEYELKVRICENDLKNARYKAEKAQTNP